MKYFVRIVGIIVGTLRAEYRQLANRYFGKHGRYDGDAISVCEQSLEKLWSGEFYRTSLGHFDFFWTRDFGTACQSLVHLGYTEQVHRTLQFALRHFRRAGAVTLCIDKHGNCFDAPNKSIDTLPWLLHSLVESDYPLNKSDVKFLNRALRKYRDTYLDTHGYLRSMKVYEMRDAVIYDRSAYAVSLVARLAECARSARYSLFGSVLLMTRKWQRQHSLLLLKKNYPTRIPSFTPQLLSDSTITGGCLRHGCQIIMEISSGVGMENSTCIYYDDITILAMPKSIKSFAI